MNLAEPGELRGLLKRHGWEPQKALGQHFLVSKNVVDAIVARVASMVGIVEIGPGPGVLTTRLLKAGHPVTAVEIDPIAVAALGETAPTATVLAQDALTVDLSALLGALPAPHAVVSNLPYNLTGPLLDRILRAASAWEVAVLMMQREVGERILAPVGHRSRGGLSLRVQYGFTIERVTNVPAGAFLPPPKVDSIVLAFTPRDDRALSPARERLWAAAFSQPRKTLVNNLTALYGREATLATLRQAKLSLDIRPHEVPDMGWEALLAGLEVA